VVARRIVVGGGRLGSEAEGARAGLVGGTQAGVSAIRARPSEAGLLAHDVAQSRRHLGKVRPLNGILQPLVVRIRLAACL
jgi:hypothetical protein